MRPIPLRRPKQKGFALVEVMAAMVLTAIFVMGISGLWAMATTQTRELVLNQKAVFVLNAEMERLSALYNLTNFAGPISCGLLGLGTCVLSSYGVYVADMGPTGAGLATSNYVTNSANTFYTTTGADFWVYYVNWSGSDRNFVWIDRTRRLMGQISWADSDVPQTMSGPKGKCEGWSLGGEALCKRLTLTLQYPYRLETSNAITALPNQKTMTLNTIVGRRR